MKLLYEHDNFCRCYISDENKLIFEMNACGIDLQYALSGHPYEPVLSANCNTPRYSFSIHGSLWFPSTEASEDDWGKFCRDLALEVVLHVAWLHNLPDKYIVDFPLLNRKTSSSLIFDGQELGNTIFCKRGYNNPYLEPVLWIESPSQRSIPKMTFVGGYPNEYCIFISELALKEKLMISTLEGNPIVKERNET